MTLSAALSTATSSLRAIQTRLTVASSNIANADDVNYTAKTAVQSSVVNGGTGTGVDISAIISKVDSNLVRSIVQATSEDSAAQTFYDYVQSLSDALGTVSSDSSGDTLSTRLSSVESTLDELAATPESATLKGEAVTSLDDAAASLRSASQQVQTLRANADSAIADAVDAVNDALHEIDSLNDAIVRGKAAGQSTADLEDQRNAALKSVAEQVNVTSYTDSTGAMKVYTGSGQILVGSDVHELSFSTTSPISSATSYPGGLSGISVNGKDITGAISSGAIAALVNVRDTTLPAVQDDLDGVAATLRDTLNTIANDASAAPPPNTLTGTDSVSAADSVSASGTLRVAITDSAGGVVSTQDLDLTAYATVGDLLSALNGISGLSASLDGEGHLVMSATTASNGVAVAGGSIGGETFSGYFGLNDVLTGNGAADIAVKADLLADSARFPVGTMSTTATLATGDSAVSAGSGALATKMADALRSSAVTDSAADIVSGVATRLSSAKSRANSAETGLNTLVDSFSSQFGVNVDEETARISELQNAYSASAQILSAVKSMFDDLLTAVR